MAIEALGLALFRTIINYPGTKARNFLCDDGAAFNNNWCGERKELEKGVDTFDLTGKITVKIGGINLTAIAFLVEAW